QESLSVSGQGVLSLANMWFCTHTPSSELVGLTSQPAIVHTLPSVSVHGVLVFGVHCPLVASQPPLHSSAAGHVLVMWFWSHTPAPLQPAVVQALLSLSGHLVLSPARRSADPHTPSSELVGLTSQPAIVHTLPSESVHGVLVFGVHWPVVVSQPPLHSSAPGHVLVTWFWSHTPAPLQPAVVQALLSLSGHGVLSVANVCACTHTPAVGSVGLASQPASVHTLPSESVHGLLTNGVDTQVPAVSTCWGVGEPGAGPVSSGHTRSVHSSLTQGGHKGMAADPWFPACRLLLQVASPLAKAAACTKPTSSSMTRGVPSLCGPEVGSGFTTMRS